MKKYFLVAVVPIVVGVLSLYMIVRNVLMVGIDKTEEFDRQISSSEKRITGTVLANNFGCAGDAACFLAVEANGDGVVNVTYQVSEEECLSVSSQHGYNVREGQKVEVYGKNYSSDLMSTCESANYYIKTIN